MLGKLTSSIAILTIVEPALSGLKGANGDCVLQISVWYSGFFLSCVYLLDGDLPVLGGDLAAITAAL